MSCLIRNLFTRSSPLSVAVKAGNMRIVQKHQPTATPEPPPKDDDEEEYETARYRDLAVQVQGGESLPSK